MKTITLRALSALLCLLMLGAFVVSCANVDDGTETTAQTTSGNIANADTTAAVTEPEYTFPDIKFTGQTFTVYNSKPVYNMINYLTVEGITGEAVNDAIYNNITKIEETFEIDFVEYNNEWDNMLTDIENSIGAQESIYDVAYIRSTHIATLMNEGYLTNLYDMEDLNFEEIWWDQRIKDDATLLGKYLYYASSEANLMSFEGTWATFFNKQMFDDLGLEYPYKLAREQKWTFDELYRLAKSGASLNGDESFTSYSASGNCVYGMASFKNFINAAVAGCNEMYVLKDNTDTPYYAFGKSATVMDTAEKIAMLTGSTADGTYISANDSTNNKHYIDDIFTQSRSLFMGGEIKAAANEMNEMTDKFGIVPIPKYNEEQKDYVSNMLWSTLLMTVPTTCSDTSRAAVIMDALSYLSYTNTLPEYYERVCYKGLYDEESVEMLNIIRDTRYLNWALAYGWLSSIEPSINTMLDGGQTTGVSALVTGTTRVVEAQMKVTMDKLNAQ